VSRVLTVYLIFRCIKADDLLLKSHIAKQKREETVANKKSMDDGIEAGSRSLHTARRLQTAPLSVSSAPNRAKNIGE